MNIYDRQYFREENQPRGVQLGGQRSMITNLLIVNAVFFLANMFFGGEKDWITNLMTAKADTLVAPWRWWELLSYGFAHSPTDIWHIVGNMFVLWMFGRAVEPIYGRGEFLRFYLTAIVLGGVVWSVRQYFFTELRPGPHLLGASGAVTAVLMLFIFHYPRQTVLLMFVIPAPAWVLGVLIVGGDLLRTFGGAEGVAADVHLVGALFAVCYFKFRWNLGRLLPGGPMRQWLRTRPLRRRQSSLRIHDPQSEGRYHEQDEHADRILDKLHRDGEESLTEKERRILEDYSRRMRQKHR